MTRLNNALVIAGLAMLVLAFFIGPTLTFFGFSISTNTVTLNSSQVTAPGVISPEYAFVSDNSFAAFNPASGQTKTGDYTGYSHSIPVGATISKVEVGLEHQEPNLAGCILFLALRVGTFAGGLATQSSEVFFWTDITSVQAWSVSTLANTVVRYEVRADVNCSSTSFLDWIPLRVTYTVATNNPPTAAFSFTPTAPLANQTVSFNATLSNDADGSIAEYKWDFGDGSPEVVSISSATATHLYSAAGNYTSKLTVTDNLGASAFSTAIVRVGASGSPPPPPPPLAVSFNWEAINLFVTFNSTVTGGTGPYTYFWDFSTSVTSSDPNPFGSFETAGTYVVLLIVTDSEGLTAGAQSEVTVVESGANTGSSTPIVGSPGSGSQPEPSALVTFAQAIFAVIGSVLVAVGVIRKVRD